MNFYEAAKTAIHTGLQMYIAVLHCIALEDQYNLLHYNNPNVKFNPIIFLIVSDMLDASIIHACFNKVDSSRLALSIKSLIIMSYIDNHISIETKYTFLIMINTSVCRLPDILFTQKHQTKRRNET